jgi:hypothetical protein
MNWVTRCRERRNDNMLMALEWEVDGWDFGRLGLLVITLFMCLLLLFWMVLGQGIRGVSSDRV